MVFDGMSGMTVRDLLEERSRDYAEKDFLVFLDRDDNEKRFGYRQYNELVNQVANLFIDLGVQKGDAVVVHLHNCVELITCLFGLAKIGATMVPVNDQNLRRESEFVLERVSPRAVVTEPEFLPMYQGIQADRPGLAERVVVACTDELIPGVLNLSLEAAKRDCALSERRAIDDGDTVQVMYTSGTTSEPKGVELTHANMIFSGQYTQWQVGLRADDVFLSAMPACHSNFQLAAMMPVLWAGATLVMVEKYSARRFMRQLRDYRATVTQAVSMMVRTLLLQPEMPDDAVNEVREVLYFLPLDVSEKEAFEKRFGMPLMNSYGSTESIGWVITDYPSGKRKFPSVGRVGLGYQVKIVDDQGYELPVGEVGEFLVRGEPGRSIMKGYFRDDAGTRRTIDSHGWMRMGDQGYVDDEGFFYFVDRSVNMIKRAGENISSAEIEDMIAQDERIAEVAVIGVPDPIRDQAVKAFVVPRAGASISEEEVLAFCSERLAAFKVPSFVEIRESLPHTTSMKVAKKLLK